MLAMKLRYSMNQPAYLGGENKNLKERSCLRVDKDFTRGSNVKELDNSKLLQKLSERIVSFFSVGIIYPSCCNSLLQTFDLLAAKDREIRFTHFDMNYESRQIAFTPMKLSEKSSVRKVNSRGSMVNESAKESNPQLLTQFFGIQSSKRSKNFT